MMSEAESEAVVHIAVGAEDVTQRASDEVSARLKSFDLRRHRTRAEAARWPVAAALTVLLLVTVLYTSRPRAASGATTYMTDDSGA